MRIIDNGFYELYKAYKSKLRGIQRKRPPLPINRIAYNQYEELRAMNPKKYQYFTVVQVQCLINDNQPVTPNSRKLAEVIGNVLKSEMECIESIADAPIDNNMKQLFATMSAHYGHRNGFISDVMTAYTLIRDAKDRKHGKSCIYRLINNESPIVPSNKLLADTTKRILIQRVQKIHEK